MTLERSYFEYRALTVEKETCPEFVPSIYYFSKIHGLIVMEYIPPPNIILRKGLIQGIRYPTMASDIATFCAKTLFRTSGFKLSESELRKQVRDVEPRNHLMTNEMIANDSSCISRHLLLTCCYSARYNFGVPTPTCVR